MTAAARTQKQEKVFDILRPAGERFDILRPTGERFDIKVDRGLTFVIDTTTDQIVTGRHYHSEFMARKVAAELNRANSARANFNVECQQAGA